MRVLRRRDAGLPLASFDSESSGGSDKGLDLALRGLAGGVVSSVVLGLLGVLDEASRVSAAKAVEFRERSTKCSNGRITRV